jgi:transitional endoplasmic reticulum ATPase
MRTKITNLFVGVPRADELSDAIEFAKQYQSPACVVFCEDVDRVTQGERSTAMDDILNIIDGIDTKRAHIITVLTSNAMETINPAMLRPGRLDAVIEVTAPDAEAIGRLIRMYGGDSVDKDADFTRIGELLAGNIPAVVEEVVRRSKLAQLALTPPGQKLGIISEQALISSAQTMAHQLDLLKKRSMPVALAPTVDGLLMAMIERAAGNGVEQLESYKKIVNYVA